MEALIVIVIIGFIIFLTIVSKRTKKKIMMRRAANFEAQQLVRIISESIQIISNTNNISTLKSRVEVVESKIERLKILEQYGFRFANGNAESILHNMYNIANNRIEEMASEQYKNIMSKRESFTSVKAAVTAISKVQQKMVDYREYLYKQGSNYDNNREQIKNYMITLKRKYSLVN